MAYSSDDKTNNGAAERIRGIAAPGGSVEGQLEKFEPIYPNLTQTQKDFFVLSNTNSNNNNNNNTNTKHSNSNKDNNSNMLLGLPIIIGDFNRLLAILEGDPDDFSLLAKKRKASKSTANSNNDTKKKSKPKPKKKKKINLDDGGDDEDNVEDYDNDDDDEWE